MFDLIKSPGRTLLGRTLGNDEPQGRRSASGISGTRSQFGRIFRSLCVVVLCLLHFTHSVSHSAAADFNDARQAYFAGNYEECIAICRVEVEKGVWNDYWSRMLIEALNTTGKYEEARAIYEQVASKFSNSIPLRVLAAESYRFSGDQEKGDQLIDEIIPLVESAPWRYSDRDNLLAIGKHLLDEGQDARAVLDAFFDRSLKSDPKFVEGYLAIAELGLDKSDYQEAAKSLKLAVSLRPEDPKIHYLQALAWAPSDPGKAALELQAALELNPRHVPSLLLQVENAMDGENYADAEQVIDQILQINPAEPRAWALKAAIAHLTGDYKTEGVNRSTALAKWKLNPEVDYLIGRTLSQHYRFAEGVKYQRRALQMKPNYTPSRFQLAQDLLRVGADDEGWSIVDQVAANDKYNVMAYNLKTLQQRIRQFTTIEVPGLIVRMNAREAEVYGAQVIALLESALSELSSKYEITLTQPVTVEIFPQQSDFAIRTFGLPGGEGFLGVCFGNLITANSPASQGESPSNWQSVLWHEFCHVITLNKSLNRMPRWLSEGISVYEELEKDPSWGQSMNPTYKAMILGEDFVPLSQLSRAFMQPKSGMHLQFAYYESSLAVRYLIETQGMPLMLKLLDDLGMGVPMEEAFSRRYGDPATVDADFEKYVKSLAEDFLPETSFDRESLPKAPGLFQLGQLARDKPDNYFIQQMTVQLLLAAERWDDAIAAAERLRELYPEDVEAGGALAALIRAHKELGNAEQERAALEQLTTLSCDNVPALLRLIELCRADSDWKSTMKHSEQLLAVQPLMTAGHESLAEASMALGEINPQTVNSLRAMMQMQPVDPAKLQYDLANALLTLNDLPAAKRAVLQALEMSPRYRDAHQLLIAIHEKQNELDTAKTTVPSQESEAGPAMAKLPDEGSPPMP